MKKRVVGIDASILQRRGTGFDRFVRGILVALRQSDEGLAADVKVLAPGSESTQLWDGDVVFVPRWCSPDYGSRGHLFRLLWHTVVLPIQVAVVKADILYFPVPEGMLTPTVPQVVTIHDLIPLRFPDVSPRLTAYYRYILPLLLKSSVGLITVSNHTKRELTEYYGLRNDSVHVVYPGIDHNRFRIVLPVQRENVKRKYGLDRYILCLGEARPYKNLVRLIRAFSTLNRADLALVIAGNLKRDARTRLLEEAVRATVSERVRLLGFVPDNELPALYCGADAFVHPSLYEGFGLPPLEAMACGCPVVVSESSSLPEVCGQAARYVNPYSVDSIADGICEVLENRSLRDTLSTLGLERAKDFAWSRTATGILEVLHSFL